jgi:hypothetical protein
MYYQTMCLTAWKLIDSLYLTDVLRQLYVCMFFLTYWFWGVRALINFDYVFKRVQRKGEIAEFQCKPTDSWPDRNHQDSLLKTSAESFVSFRRLACRQFQ